MSDKPEALALADMVDSMPTSRTWLESAMAMKLRSLHAELESAVAAAVAKERERCSHWAGCAISRAKDADWDAAECALNLIASGKSTEPTNA